METTAGTPSSPSKPKQSTAALALLALGVVYGDIGTSPLYAAKETFNPEHGIPLTAVNVIGGVSAIFWTLMIVVSLKYVTLVGIEITRCPKCGNYEITIPRIEELYQLLAKVLINPKRPNRRP